MLTAETPRDVVRLHAFPPEEAPAPSVMDRDVSRDRDIFWLGQDDPADAGLQREDALHQLDMAAAQLEQTLALLDAYGPDIDTDLVRSQISDSLSHVQAMKDQARSAPDAAIPAIARSVPQIVSGALATTGQALGQAEMEEVLIQGDVAIEKMHLISAEQIHGMSVSQMAETFSPAHFARMDRRQLDAVRARTDETVSRLQGRVDETDAMIEGSGLANDTYRGIRDRLEAEEEEARRKDDRLAVAKLTHAQLALQQAQLAAAGETDAAAALQPAIDEARDAALVTAAEEEQRKILEERAQGAQISEEDAAKRIEAAQQDTADEITDRATAISEEVAAGAGKEVTSVGEWVGVQATYEGDHHQAEDEQVVKNSGRFQPGGFGFSALSGAEAADPHMETAVAEAKASGATASPARPTEDQPDTSDPDAPTLAAAKPKLAEAGPSPA